MSPRIPANSGEDPQDDIGKTIQAFGFEEKALQAAESFILARFHLYSQVYLHKTTRGIEQMLTTFLLRFSEECKKGDKAALVVPPDHPLRVFYADSIPSLNNYIALDDTVIWTVLESSVIKGTGEIRDLAERICSRKILKSVSINVVNPQLSMWQEGNTSIKI